MGRLCKKAAGKACESWGMRRTLAYAAMTKDEALAQPPVFLRSRQRLFAEAQTRMECAATISTRVGHQFNRQNHIDHGTFPSSSEVKAIVNGAGYKRHHKKKT